MQPRACNNFSGPQFPTIKIGIIMAIVKIQCINLCKACTKRQKEDSNCYLLNILQYFEVLEEHLVHGKHSLNVS